MIEKIKHKDLNLAIIIRSNFKKNGIEFFTDDEDTMQIGYMQRQENYEIKPHRHNSVARTVHLTQEVLFLKSGKVRVDFYDHDEIYIKSSILNQGDVILLIDGGHGFKMIASSEIIEVKQGPFLGDLDKVRFNATEDSKIVY